MSIKAGVVGSATLTLPAGVRGIFDDLAVLVEAISETEALVVAISRASSGERTLVARLVRMDGDELTEVDAAEIVDINTTWLFGLVVEDGLAIVVTGDSTQTVLFTIGVTQGSIAMGGFFTVQEYIDSDWYLMNPHVGISITSTALIVYYCDAHPDEGIEQRLLLIDRSGAYGIDLGSTQLVGLRQFTWDETHGAQFPTVPMARIGNTLICLFSNDYSEGSRGTHAFAVNLDDYSVGPMAEVAPLAVYHNGANQDVRVIGDRAVFSAEWNDGHGGSALHFWELTLSGLEVSARKVVVLPGGYWSYGSAMRVMSHLPDTMTFAQWITHESQADPGGDVWPDPPPDEGIVARTLDIDSGEDAEGVEAFAVDVLQGTDGGWVTYEVEDCWGATRLTNERGIMSYLPKGSTQQIHLVLYEIAASLRPELKGRPRNQALAFGPP